MAECPGTGRPRPRGDENRRRLLRDVPAGTGGREPLPETAVEAGRRIHAVALPQRRRAAGKGRHHPDPRPERRKKPVDFAPSRQRRQRAGDRGRNVRLEGSQAGRSRRGAAVRRRNPPALRQPQGERQRQALPRRSDRHSGQGGIGKTGGEPVSRRRLVRGGKFLFFAAAR
ncbi:hypothetical protein SDC9_163612 [bioreactor metagenome]|uniref:Uncharacterized protein n=1 Tax=bioreactor metagenome TaxID=1076179 RepID=A0A645FW72_9ZZZZ